MRFVRSHAVVLAAAMPLILVAGCSNKAQPYKPKPGYSGKAVQLPAPPTLPAKPIKVGDAYTVWGARHHLRSLVHSKQIKGKDISMVGFVVKTNFPDAPECAVHPTGKADPEGCKPPVPAFWISDEKGGDVKTAVKVLGFASNFAQIYDRLEKDKKESEEPVTDEFYGVTLPTPVPNVDAKVKITGSYGFTYTRATAGIETDPKNGILTYQKIEYIEKPPTPATLPGMKE